MLDVNSFDAPSGYKIKNDPSNRPPEALLK